MRFFRDARPRLYRIRRYGRVRELHGCIRRDRSFQLMLFGCHSVAGGFRVRLHVSDELAASEGSIQAWHGHRCYIKIPGISEFVIFSLLFKPERLNCFGFAPVSWATKRLSSHTYGLHAKSPDPLATSGAWPPSPKLYKPYKPPTLIL